LLTAIAQSISTSIEIAGIPRVVTFKNARRRTRGEPHQRGMALAHHVRRNHRLRFGPQAHLSLQPPAANERKRIQEQKKRRGGRKERRGKDQYVGIKNS